MDYTHHVASYRKHYVIGLPTTAVASLTLIGRLHQPNHNTILLEADAASVVLYGDLSGGSLRARSGHRFQC
jgi:hypothetical protein